jgi:serine/threonine-protein kinase
MPGLSFTSEFLAQFEVVGLVGEGGMGVVYKSIQRSVDRPVAVKFLSRALLTDDYLPRFRAEAKLAGQVIHTNLVAVFETGAMDRLPYIVFEYIDGPSLRGLLARNGDDLPLGRALDLARQAADGLECAHRAGIIHRDVKPENLLVGPNDVMKVADFGIARGLASTTGAKTRTGILLGTPAYMAPEQALEQPAGPAADIYSLGVVLYEMIARRVPFDAASTLEILDQHVHSPPPALDEAVPFAVRRLVERAIAKRPQERFESMAALSRELVRVGRLSARSGDWVFSRRYF